MNECYTDWNEAVALLSALITIPSVNPAFQTDADPPDIFGEQEKARYVHAWLIAAGVEARLQMALPERPNVIAKINGTVGHRTLLLECHLDTVQVRGMVAPFRPRLQDGRLFGRGAVDDGGCVAAMLLAMRALQQNPPAANVVLLAAIDEEYQFRGVAHYLAQGQRVDGAIAGEPTRLRVVTACKGCVRWRVEVLGRAAHSSNPSSGIDAISAATALLAHLRNVFRERLTTRHHPLVGTPTLICSMIEGGEGPNTVAERCVLTFDRRTLPGETGVDAWREMEAENQHFALTNGTGATFVVHPPFIDSRSMAVDEAHSIVRVALGACRDAGLPAAAAGVSFGSDATHLNAAGIPSIIFGPGAIEQAHALDEFVGVAEVVQAARIMEAVARRFGAAE